MLNAVTPRVLLIGNGTRGPFSLTVSGTGMRVRDIGDIVVTRYASTAASSGTVLAANTDFTLSNVNPDAATITLTSAQSVLASTERLLIERLQPVDQSLSLSLGGDFSGPAVMAALDRIAEYLQEVRRDADRAVKAAWNAASAPRLPLAPSSATQLLGHNTSGDLVHVATTEPTVIVDSEWGDILAASPGDGVADFLAGDLGDGWAAILAQDPSAVLDDLDAAKVVATHAALAATPLANADAAILIGRDAAGDCPMEVFRPLTGDQSALVTEDPGQFDTIAPATSTTGVDGAWRRASGSLREIRLDRGVKFDGVTNISTAFNRAISLLIARGGGRLILPAGVGRITSNLTEWAPTGEEDLIIEGQGRDVTELRFSGSVTRGIKYRPTTTTANRLPHIAFRGLTMKTSAEAVDWAIDCEWAIDADIEEPFYAEDIAIGQWFDDAADDGSDYGYWLRLMRVKNARNSGMKGFRFGGEMDRSSNKSEYGILLAGECTSWKIHDGDISECLVGVRAQDTSEGVYLDGVDMVAVRDGLVLDFSGGEPQHTFTNGHINALRYSVYANNVMQLQITSSAFTAKAGWSADNPSENWTGVYLTGSATRHGDILGMKFAKESGHGSAGATSIGVRINQGYGCNVAVGSFYSDDSGDPLDVGVQLDSGAQYCNVSTIQTRYCTTGILDAGSYTKKFGNTFRNFTTAIDDSAATGGMSFDNDIDGTAVMSQGATHRVRHTGENNLRLQRISSGGAGNYIGGIYADAYDSAGNLDTYFRCVVQQQDHTSGSEDTYVFFDAFSGGSFRTFYAFDGAADAHAWYSGGSARLVLAGDTFRSAADGATNLGAPSIKFGTTFTNQAALKIYTVATMPSPTEGMVAYASDGRKNGEGVGSGTGVLAFYDGSAWIACDSGATLAA